MTKTETLSIRLTADDKAVLQGICEDYGVKPGTFARVAVSAWLAACRESGGYVKPEFKCSVEVDHA